MSSLSFSSKRIEWVDAMRGFSMVLVVFGHVMLDLGIGNDDTILSSLLITFRMPLFFFVSGFFSFRVRDWWTPERVGDIMLRKFNAQIITAIIFFALYQYLIAHKPINYERGLDLYWFTIVLFQMYTIYMILSVIDRVIRKSLSLSIMVILSITAIIVLIFFFHETRISKMFSWYRLLYYFQFFTYGIICSKYRDRFFNLLKNNTFKTIVIILLVVSLIGWSFSSIISEHPNLHFLNRFELSRFMALTVVIFMFYESAARLSGTSFIARSLRYTGRRTLDLYYIHFFFLPHISYLKQYLLDNDMIAIQVLVTSIITIVVVILSLMVSAVLRSSKTLTWFMFGVKTKK